MGYPNKDLKVNSRLNESPLQVKQGQSWPEVMQYSLFKCQKMCFLPQNISGTGTLIM